MKNILKWVVMGSFLLAALWACSSTKLVQRWHDPGYTGPKLQKVLVLGVFKDEAQRRAFEQTFTDQINVDGKHAVPGYSLVPNPGDIKSKAAVVAAVQKAGADSVLITHFKGVSKTERQIPPRVDYVPTGGLDYYGYYAPIYQRVYSPGYTVVDSVVKLETHIYTLKDERLIWAANSESVNASSSDKIVHELVRLIVSDMKKRGLIE